MDIKINKFENNISIKNIEAFYKYILEEIKKIPKSEKENEIFLDLEDITWIDSSFVQTFLFLENKLKKEGFCLKMKNVNEIIKSEFENFFINIDNFL